MSTSQLDISTQLRFQTTAGRYRRASLFLIAIAVVCVFLSDIAIHHASPWLELSRMATGFASPDFFATEFLWLAIANTIAFALQGVTVAFIVGMAFALLWHLRFIRMLCACLRSVHELFWALLLLPVLGLSPLTGMLAIAIPFSGIIGKVFAEILEETSEEAANALSPKVDFISQFFFARLPLAWQAIRQYTGYRLECAIRTSTLLGFIGLPTLGFYLETYFRQGQYDAGAALIYVFFLIIVCQRFWFNKQTLWFVLPLSFYWFPPASDYANLASASHFFQQLIPAPIRGENTLVFTEVMTWLTHLWQQQALPGIYNTVILSIAALALSMVLGLLMMPWSSKHFGNLLTRNVGNSLLILLRTTPELVLAFIFLLLLGPSMLPAIIALAIHTGAILAHLGARFSNHYPLRPDSSVGLNRYCYEILPRAYPQFLALSLYRWEILMRETAVLGILGITTLGFYVDSAFAEFRFDRALLLIIIGVLLNIMVDALSRKLRQILRLQSHTITAS